MVEPGNSTHLPGGGGMRLNRGEQDVGTFRMATSSQKIVTGNRNGLGGHSNGVWPGCFVGGGGFETNDSACYTWYGIVGTPRLGDTIEKKFNHDLLRASSIYHFLPCLAGRCLSSMASLLRSIHRINRSHASHVRCPPPAKKIGTSTLCNVGFVKRVMN